MQDRHANPLHLLLLADEMGADRRKDRIEMGDEPGVRDMRGVGEHLLEGEMVLVHHGDAKGQLGQVHGIPFIKFRPFRGRRGHRRKRHLPYGADGPGVQAGGEANGYPAATPGRRTKCCFALFNVLTSIRRKGASDRELENPPQSQRSAKAKKPVWEDTAWR